IPDHLLPRAHRKGALSVPVRVSRALESDEWADDCGVRAVSVPLRPARQTGAGYTGDPVPGADVAYDGDGHWAIYCFRKLGARLCHRGLTGCPARETITDGQLGRDLRPSLRSLRWTASKRLI